MNTLINLIRGAKYVKRFLQKIVAGLRSVSKNGFVTEETYAHTNTASSIKEEPKSDTQTANNKESKSEAVLDKVDATLKFVCSIVADILDLAVGVCSFLESLDDVDPAPAS